MSITDELREYTEKQIKWMDMTKVHYRKLFAIADRIDAAADGMVELPKDADGVPIRIGDELDYLEALHTDVPARFKVQDMFYFGKGEWRLRAYPATYEPKKCRHHHAPSVEDVLTEMFAKAIERGELTNGGAQTIAEYAKRLTLAEVEDA